MDTTFPKTPGNDIFRGIEYPFRFCKLSSLGASGVVFCQIVRYAIHMKWSIKIPVAYLCVQFGLALVVNNLPMLTEPNDSAGLGGLVTFAPSFPGFVLSAYLSPLAPDLSFSAVSWIILSILVYFLIGVSVDTLRKFVSSKLHPS